MNIKKNIKRIFLSILLILIFSLTTQKSYAGFLDEKYFDKTNPWNGTFSLFLEDLMSKENWTLLCSERGQHFPSKNTTSKLYNDAEHINEAKEYVMTKEFFENMIKNANKDKGQSSVQYEGKYIGEQDVAYTVKDKEMIAKPKEAYVLNKMEESINSYSKDGLPGDQHYTDIQKAWYKLFDQGNGLNSDDYNEAIVYQDFVNEIKKKSSDINNTSKYKELSHTFENGKTIKIDFPEIDYDKIQNSITLKTTEAVTNFDKDSQKYIIGPFTLNYTFKSFNDIVFGALDGFDIYTDADDSQEALNMGTDWKFIFSQPIENKADKVYPDPNEEFYIEMNHISGLTQITGIDIKYKYLVAGAKYHYLEGTYDRFSWEAERKVVQGSPIYETDENGQVMYDENNSPIQKKDENGNLLYETNYHWEKKATDQGLDKRSQKLSFTDSAARWYETAEINVVGATLKIDKKVVYGMDEPEEKRNQVMSQEEIKENFGEDQYFTFNVKVKYGDGREEEKDVVVKGGETATVGTYFWEDTKSSAPTYEIKEITPDPELWDAWNLDREGKGTLEEGKTTVVTAYNQAKSKRNKIELSKTLMGGVADEDEEFLFNVVVKTKSGKEIGNDIAKITVHKGEISGDSWSKEYSWNEDGDAIYEITEIQNEWSKKYESVITPSVGVLNGDKSIVNVNALNYMNKNRIVLTKEMMSPATKDEVFNFKITITTNDGNTHEYEEKLEVKKGEYKSATDWTSEWIYWDPNKAAPTYTVEEIGATNYNCIITPSSGTFSNYNENGEIIVTAMNFSNDTYKKKYKNSIEITKTLNVPAATDETFEFEVEVTEYIDQIGTEKKYKENATIVVPKGETTGKAWVSGRYSWEHGQKAPTYIIKEKENEWSRKYTPTMEADGATWDSGTKTLSGEFNGGKVKIQVKVNNSTGTTEKNHKGYLMLEKALADNQTTDSTFTFDVKVEGVKNSTNGTVEFPVTLKPGEKSENYEFYWVGNTAPKFTVTERNNDNTKDVKIDVTNGNNINKSGKTVTGSLVESEKATGVQVKFTNTLTETRKEEHKGNIIINKEFFSTEKMTKEQLKKTAENTGVTFDVEVTVEGNFKYGNEIITNSSKVIKTTLSKDNNWQAKINDIIWYGSDEPTYTVKEVNLKNNWICKGVNYVDVTTKKHTNKVGQDLYEGDNHVTITNEIPVRTVIDLTFTMSGFVWEDKIEEKKNTDEYKSRFNGVYDNGEAKKENVEVKIYRVVRYNDRNERDNTPVSEAYIDTNKTKVSWPILTDKEGNWKVPRMSVPVVTDAEKANGAKYADYDVEFTYDGQTYEPTEFLSYKGDDKIDGNNQAKAIQYIKDITTNENNAKLYAKCSMAVEETNNNTKIQSISGKSVIDDNGNTVGVVHTTDNKDIDITYSSSDKGQAYPTHSTLNTTDSNGRVLDVFKATATTSQGGLLFPVTDTGSGSALTNKTTTVSASGIEHTYTFIAAYDHCLNINLGLRKREEVDIALAKNLTDAKVVVNEKMYQYNYSGKFDLTETKQDTLLKDIAVESGTKDIEYTLGLYKSDYYYRAEMYKKGNDKVYNALEKFYKTLNKEVTDTEMDIYLTYVIKLRNSSSKYNVTINSLDDYYDDKLELIKEPESKYLKKQTIDGTEYDVNNSVVVAKASDFADKWTNAYTINGSDGVTYNKMTANNLGIVLEPGKEKVVEFTFKVKKTPNNDINGKDAIALGEKCNVAEIGSYTTYYDSKFAGKIDRDSAPGNVNIKKHNDKKWYEDDTFAAPKIDVKFKNEHGEDRTITGFVWEDNSNNENVEKPAYNQTIGNGKYDDREKKIDGLTTELVEKVIVQDVDQDGKDTSYTEYEFIWPTTTKIEALGNRTIQDITDFASTTKTDKEGIYKFTNPIAGDYVVKFTYGDKKIESAKYSNAEYYNGQDYKSTKFNAYDINELTADTYLDLDKLNGGNTAIDSEVRRLEVINKSRTLNNEKTSMMKNYDENLFKDYYMFACTPKINVNIEHSQSATDNKEYSISNVNFGLEERPMTKLTLDKQIEEIILTTSDGRKIMDALYDISYTVDKNGKITSIVKLNTEKSTGVDNLQAVNRNERNKGFRYINIDSTILEGTTITVKYRLTVLNTGEVDRTGKLANIPYEEDLKDKINNLSDVFAKYKKQDDKLVNTNELGQYVGNIYYYGKDGNTTDSIVQSNVEQLVDYIDNDMTHNNLDYWKLCEDEGYLKYSDSEKVSYKTDKRNNVVVNKNSLSSLQPYAVNEEKYSTYINITTTRYMGSDSDDLKIDNIAEILEYNNTVGRRDEEVILGNLNPAEVTNTEERDTSATEVITLAPPTGSGLSIWKIQIIATVSIGLLIITGGIILIKKKILK